MKQKNNLIYYEHHLHSHYSVNDALNRIPDIVKYAKKTGRDSVTLTDHGTLAGIYQLWKECNKEGLKPVIGMEPYYVDDYNSEASQVKWNYAHFILIAKNETGWNNLKLINAKAWEEGFSKKPRISFGLLKEHSKGLICSSGCISGLVGWNYLQENDKYYGEKSLKFRKKLVLKRIMKFKKLFGDDFYLEIHLNDLPQQAILNKYILQLADEFEIKVIVAGDCHYLKRTDYKYHDIMICNVRKTLLDDVDNKTYPTRSLFMKDYKRLVIDMEAWHDDYMNETILKECVRNTKEISDKVEKFPIKPDIVCLPKWKNANQKMKDWCERGWKTKLTEEQQNSKKYKDRLKYEYNVFEQLSMEPYMLVCADITQMAIKENIPIGPGRGSACGSLVAFLMDITQVDPIRFDTSFDRFLISSRLSLPDIDMDFGRNSRDKLKELVRKKYGEENFAAIVTYGDWKPRGAIKDVAKVLGREFKEINDVTKKISDRTKKFEDEDNPIEPEVVQWLMDNKEIARPAMFLEGIIRNRGVHASGMILTPTPLENWSPIAYMTDRDSDDKKPVKVSEWDMYALEDLNILKIDFLGLQTLDVIYKTVDFVNKKEKVIGDIWSTILNDLENKDVYAEICLGHLLGIFQLESSEGMLQLTKRLKPCNFEDINMLISLYRTAVLEAGMADEYVNRRFGKEFDYIHDKTESALKNTYGVMVHQEQLMKIAVDCGGFTPQESDNFRKATKLKDPEKFKPWKEQFIQGCIKNGFDDEQAEELWDWCYAFAGYGFNRCITGNTKIYRFTGNQFNKKEITVRELYNMEHGEPRNKPIRKKFRRQGHLGLVRVYNPEKHKIQYGKVKTVHYNGLKQVYRVCLKNGMSIECTATHRLMKSDKSYEYLFNLEVGDKLMVCGDKDINYNKQETEVIGGICNSCHKKLDYEIGNRNGDRDKGYYAVESEIVSIGFVGIKQTYDLEMLEEPHNFIANGIVSHNSHSVAYALISYATAWLKCHYSKQFMAALMTYNVDEEKMMPKYIRECNRLNIKVLKPDVNLSKQTYRIVKEGIVSPFRMIKGVGEKVIENIIYTRKSGKFESFEDFYERVSKRIINVRVMTSLVLSGAFENLENETIEEVFDKFIETRPKEKVYRQYYCKSCKYRYPCNIKESEAEQSVCDNCNGEITFDDCEGKKFNQQYIVNFVYGYVFGDNPLKKYVNKIAKFEAEYISAIEDCDDAELITVAATVVKIKNHIDKRGGKMAFIDLTDGETDCSITVFASSWEDKLEEKIKVGHSYIIKAYKNRGNNLLFNDRAEIKSKFIKLGI